MHRRFKWFAAPNPSVSERSSGQSYERVLPRESLACVGRVAPPEGFGLVHDLVAKNAVCSAGGIGGCRSMDRPMSWGALRDRRLRRDWPLVNDHPSGDAHQSAQAIGYL
jgi:hypothetical protein